MSALTVPEQREAQGKRGLNLAFLLFSLVVMTAIFLYCAFLCGKYEGRQEARAEFDSRPRPVISRSFALTQWKCDRQEAREYLNACTKRKGT